MKPVDDTVEGNAVIVAFFGMSEEVFNRLEERVSGKSLIPDHLLDLCGESLQPRLQQLL